MAHLTISVPGDLVDDMRDELSRAHAERAAAVREALEAYLVSHERLDDVHGALVELTDLDEALGQLGWEPAGDAQPVELTAHPEVLADALAAIEGRRVRARVARLLVIGETEARAVLGLADRRRMTLADLEAEFDLSPGGAVALAARLEHEALVVREPDPNDPAAVRLALSASAERALAAARRDSGVNAPL
jgi:DNA-binding MarR family transcriptional regulator